MKFSLSVRAFLLVALLTSPLHAEKDYYGGQTWAFLDVKKTLEAANEITLAKYPNCDEATVDEKIVQVYRADGKGENQDEFFLKVLTEKGKRDRRTLNFGYMLPYSIIKVIKLETIKPNGDIVPVDIAANSKVSIDESQMQMNIYDPNSKILEVNVPSLDIGDVLHVVTREETNRPIIPGEFADEQVFEGEGYLRHTSYEVHAPADKPLQRIFLRNEVPGTIKATTVDGEEKTKIYRWEVSNVPRMFAEPSMPPFSNVLQRVEVSTTPTWQDISKWYWELSKAHLEATTPELKAKVTELTAKATTDLDKTKALFYYVSQKIRYMGLTPEKDRPGFEPHDVCITYDKKYGVCRDKAALLVSMLRAADLKAFPVLINVGTKMDPDVPNPGFNHAIVAVELTPDSYQLMDPTDEHARDLLPWYDGNQSYLVCRPEGEGLKISPIQDPDKNMMRISTTGTLQANGELVATSELSFEGANDDIYRGAFSSMKDDDRRRFFERSLKEAMPGARLVSLKLTPEDMTDVTHEIHAQVEFAVAGMTATGSGKSVVSLPWIGKNLGLVNYIMRGMGLDKRLYPMITRIACGLDEKISLKLGEGFAAAESLPSCVPVNDDCISYGETFAAKDGTLEGSRDLKLKVVEFSPAQYLELKKTLKDMAYDARKSPVMSMTTSSVAATAVASPKPAPPVESNATILYSHKTLNVTDAHSSVYNVKFSKKILTYAGKQRESEIKIDYNPSCEEARFIRGVVTSKDGKRQEASKGEINVMDASTSAAKRYTGGKVLVVNLPGVEIGSTIEIEYEIVTKDAPFIGDFEAFQLPDEVVEKSFLITAPDSLKIEQRTTDASTLKTPNLPQEKGKQGLQWTATNLPALPAEPQLPPDWLFTPGVSYFAGDFKAYLNELNSTMVDRSGKNAKAAEMAKQITAGKSKLEAVKAIRDFVATTIRLAGPEFTDLPLKELSAADTTLADGYGHLADRAILLHSMLTAAGFQPEFVLASSLPAIENIQQIASSSPLPESFNSPIVKLTVDDTTIYLNDTDQYAQLGTTAFDGKLGLALKTQEVGVIAAAANYKDKTEIVYNLSFTDTGALRMGFTKHYYGQEFNVRNRQFSEYRPEQKARVFQELVSGVAQGARPVGGLKDDFSTYPGSIQYTVDLDNYAVVDGNYLYFNLPFTPSLYDFSMEGDRRSRPLMVTAQGTNIVRTEIDLPPGYQKVVVAPKNETLKGPAGSGTVQITTTTAMPGKISLTDTEETASAIVSPQEYPEMLHVESTLEKKSARVFLLQKN